METQEQPIPDILTPYEYSKSIWATHTETGIIDDFHQYSLVDDFMYKRVLNSYDSTLGFGKFEGLTIQEIFDKDKSYLEFCIRELDYFFLSFVVVRDMLSSGYEFSQESVTKNKQKLCDYKWGTVLLRMRDDEHEDERDSGSSYDDDDWGGDANNNPHYNDDLDMDQQSQEFWDNL